MTAKNEPEWERHAELATFDLVFSFSNSLYEYALQLGSVAAQHAGVSDLQTAAIDAKEAARRAGERLRQTSDALAALGVKLPPVLAAIVASVDLIGEHGAPKPTPTRGRQKASKRRH